MNEERPIVDSRLIDHFLAVGIAADSLAKLTVFGDVEVHIRKGRIEVSAPGSEPHITAGTMYVDPSADDWDLALRYVRFQGVAR